MPGFSFCRRKFSTIDTERVFESNRYHQGSYSVNRRSTRANVSSSMIER
ncbi:hypothetical protein X946_2905 [Burkholderia sp. ABCPW 111]|nr:hypothetical protein X946_2905 [Burkholderia sp. ABCPW 111]